MEYEDFKEKYCPTLNQQQEQALRQTNGPVLLLAVPGSGKTTVIVARVGHMILCENIVADKILTLTFSKEAAKEMKHRFETKFSEDISRIPDFRTIHSFCYYFLRHEFESQTGRPLPTIENFPNHIIRKLFNEYKHAPLINEIAQKIGFCKNMMLTEDKIDEIEIDEVASFFELYAEYCKKMALENKMDYDDILVMAYKMIIDNPSIINKYRQRYAYINVDEAQDTSKIQHEIIRLLSGENPNLFMVGDEDQCIYAFRAAYPEALLQFNEIYPGATVLKMEINYRSSNEIITIANKFIKQNVNRFDKTMRTNNDQGSSAVKQNFSDIKQQYGFIAEKISKVRGDKGTVAVLYRNNDSAVAVIDCLVNKNIKFSIKDPQKVINEFFESTVVLDIINFLKFTNDVYDANLFSLLYYKLGLSISKDMMERICRKAKQANIDVVEALMQMALSECNEHQFGKVYAFKNAFNSIRDLQPTKAISSILIKLKYDDYLIEQQEKGGCSLVSQSTKINTLKIISERFLNIMEFLKYIEHLKDSISRLEIDDKVVLSTVHSCKGLEFDSVMMVDLCEGVFPTKPNEDNLDKSKLLEEERRLFYVGITRAKKELIFLVYEQAFDKTVEISSFVFDVFPLPKTVSVNKNMEPTSRGISTMYIEGTIIKHNVLGEGKIISRKDDKISVRFSCKVEQLSVSWCLKNRLISICGFEF